MALVVVAVVGCFAGIAAGLASGPLWLDEALSVNIAGLPLPELYAGLRQDGAPPLYYLLLKAWMALFGTGTVVVRIPSVLLTVAALALAYRVGCRLVTEGWGGRRWPGPGADPRTGGRAAVVVLASMPWTMRFGSETRMYVLVVVLVLAGALALLAVHRSPSRPAVLGLAACVAALLLTHYWSLFLLAAVAAVHLPGVLRRRPEALRVAAAGVLGALAFLPWLPTFLFQATHTGAPWAVAPGVLDLLSTPQMWGAGSATNRSAFGLLLVGLVVAAVVRRPVSRPLAAVAVLAMLLGWGSVAAGGGAYTARYTAVVVPLIAVAAALGAGSLPGPRLPLVALGVVTAIGLPTGIPAAGHLRTPAALIAEQFRAAAAPGDLLVYCPDQLGPPVARLLGPEYPQVVYPSLAPPEQVDWVDYEARQDAADPTATAAQIDALAGDRAVFLLRARGYRTFEGDCEELFRGLYRLRGEETLVYGEAGTVRQVLLRFP